MDRLTISEVNLARTGAQPSLALKPLSYKQYDAFKSPHSLKYNPSKLSLKHLSVESQQFSGASLKKLATPSPSCPAIQLCTGRPNADHFPWKSFQSGPETVTKSMETPRNDSESNGPYELTSMLDYGHAAGSPQLLRFITEHVELVHNPPYADWGTCLSSGSTSALDISLRIFCNRGDNVICEQFTYAGFLEVADLFGLKTRGIDMDNDGIRPVALRTLLKSWNWVDGDRPHVLYMIPSGQNPTGVSQPAERKAEIYTIAEEYDMIIIEDDPYYFLNLDTGNVGSSPRPESLNNLTPSYVSLDTSGRVVRLDSVSKILAPGLRAGWVTANDSIISKFLSYHEVSSAFVSGPSQLMLIELLDETWGHEGFFNWLQSLSKKYRQRRDIMIEACKAHLPKSLCNWSIPSSGIYIWVQINTEERANYSSVVSTLDTESEDSRLCIENRIQANAFEKGVQVTNGSMFEANTYGNQGLNFRLTFATADEALLYTGVRLFAEAIKEEFNEVSHSAVP
ncbi:L-kynurenine/alpha-aminoadipate aminotransferase [Pseudovirgaria hyperparasitica]|uniref:L-kynurenine/alpha-aminoadipate aminotransferase n=1 Tax=Pseudovirgaria hyperparasitica TaxID=470096 RepID=A0A6A6WJN5_9PEZI|nr:L-kynurenine/alpha-aminoadipate aminotransferase [Pseudovirgaria hyperparasitica]KAF2762466.1 L-kynurenine/alpha-aminoadipate aminotransferase [Pseudovirgaria hyperparasitica]